MRLMDVLGAHYRLIAPDYPGFGRSDAPASSTAGGPFTYTFDRLADITEGFVRQLGLSRFVLYVFDFGAPVGFRLAARHPEWIAGLVVQNGNAYEEGLSQQARDFIALRPEAPGAADTVRSLLTLPATRGQYEGGTADPELVAPDGWTLDQHFLDLPGRTQPQLDLAFDYHSNVALYPQWQDWLRQHTPPHARRLGRSGHVLPRARRPRLSARSPGRRTAPLRDRALRPGGPPPADRTADRGLPGPHVGGGWPCAVTLTAAKGSSPANRSSTHWNLRVPGGRARGSLRAGETFGQV